MNIYNFAASLPLSTSVSYAVCGGLLEYAFKSHGIKEFGALTGTLINTFVDYPQSFAAASVAVSILGKGPVGSTVCVGFLAVPILCKVVSTFTSEVTMIHRLAEGADHFIRIAAKIMNMLGAVSDLRQTGQLQDLPIALGKLYLLSFLFVKDAAHTATYALEKVSYYNYVRLLIKY